MIICRDTNILLQARARSHAIFTDCAITAAADYVVTEDRHFAPLATAGYHPQPITPAEYISKYL